MLAGVKPGPVSSSCRRWWVISRARSTAIPNSRTSDLDGEVGIGITYDVSSDLSTEATINPDFSQVESDAAQIDVNSTFALFYPEKRPFFQEGSDLFETYFEAVYTRSINDPLGAGKFTWRNGSNSMAFLTGYDEHSPLILPFEESSEIVENGESYSNILRARHDFGDQSHVGLIATDRRFDGGGSGSLVGADTQIRFSPSNTFRLQVLATHTEEVNNLALTDSAFNETRFDDDQYTRGLDGESFWGHGAYALLMRETRNYWLMADYWEKSPTFRADNGFEPSNNYRMPSAEAGVIKRFDEPRVVESLAPNVEAARKWNFDGVQKDEWVMTNLEGHLRAAQTGLSRDVHGEQRALQRHPVRRHLADPRVSEHAAGRGAELRGELQLRSPDRAPPAGDGERDQLSVCGPISSRSIGCCCLFPTLA